ncbi:hypothetical protein AVEN_16421-1 [Araneus ventricosus]|uniref:Uncharacterized protein n=1 Tax=Araneus ventricosus TaxID=182803 RepID=A0A4Y2F0N0_ARAVE|nr:hypothetical protein AVEN_16421-1 [Araneus ventricosus]
MLHGTEIRPSGSPYQSESTLFFPKVIYKLCPVCPRVVVHKNKTPLPGKASYMFQGLHPICLRPHQRLAKVYKRLHDSFPHKDSTYVEEQRRAPRSLQIKIFQQLLSQQSLGSSVKATFLQSCCVQEWCSWIHKKLAFARVVLNRNSYDGAQGVKALLS